MNKNVDTLYYITPVQHGMLHHSQLDRASGVYVEQFSCILAGPLDADRFKQAWAAVVHRHDVLKTLFIRLHEGKPLQVVRKQVALPWRSEDWSDLDAASQRHRFETLLDEDRARGFDPSQAPLMRLQLTILGPQRHRFLWSYHHAILDGWSMPILLNEVFQIYASSAQALPAPVADYRHYVAWLREQDQAQARAFWTDTLKGYRTPIELSPSMLPQDTPASPRRLATASGAMPAEWAEAAVKMCRAHKITLNTLCQGAWSALLGLYADQDDIVYGTVMSGRAPEIAGVDGMVGLFINTLPARVKLDPDLPLTAWLRQIQSSTMQAERYAYSPLTEVLQCTELPPRQALFDTLYVFENYPGQAAFRTLLASNQLEVQELRVAEQTNYSLVLIVLPADGLQFHFTYDTARFSAPAIQRMLNQYRVLLQYFVGQQGERVQNLRLEAAAPVTAVADPSPVARDTSLFELLSRHAGAAPEQPAYVTATHDLLDYGALTKRVEHALRRWRRLGYRPGDRVLLLSDGDVEGLVMLLSGLAHGIDCLLPDPDVPLEALLAAGATAWGSEAVHGCVVTQTRPAPSLGMRCDVFGPHDLAWQPPAANMQGDGAAAPNPARGACSLVSLGGERETTLVRYEQQQLVQAAAWFATVYPVKGARGIPIIHSPLAHSNLWTVLMALGAGLTLHRLDPGGEQNFLQAAAAGGIHWHAVRLSSAQTRELARAAPPATLAMRADHWVVDAGTATTAGLQRLRALDAQARPVRELRWPANSLPHAASEPGASAGPGELGQPMQGGGLHVIDQHLRPAAIDARGRLAVSGPSVPAALLRRGMPDRSALLTTRQGPLLLTGLQAWNGPFSPQTQLPQAAAGIEAALPRWRELEAILAAQAGVRELALVERLSEREWQHALFYAPSQAAQGADLATRLQTLCATHGLADAVLTEVIQLPRHPHGVDRLALLRGEVRVMKRQTHVAPRDEIESDVHAIWSGLLGRECISVDEDFFDLGGQSLLASVMLYQIEEKTSIALDMETLFEFPTIAGLAHALRAGSQPAARTRRDLSQDAVLAADVIPSSPYQPSIPAHVFLTGATGFLGTHLLVDLLDRTSAQVHCLVRAADEASGHKRLTDALKAHGLWHERHAARIVAVPGGLEKPLFGLSAAQFDALAQRVDSIYHNGAMVNFVYPYSSLKQVNVSATEDVLRLACRHRAKPVHYISTVGVLDRTAESIPEQLGVPLHEHLMTGYEQSKWVAEQLVRLAGERGLPVSIYRPSRIVGHSKTGRINTDDLFCRLIKGMALFGKAPRDVGLDNMLPVDLVSRIIVEASLQPAVHGQAVHVVNPQWNSFDALVDYIEAQGHAIERLDYETWLAQLALHVKQHPEHPLAMLIGVLKKLNPVADPSVGRRLPIAHDHMSQWAGNAIAGALRPADEWLSLYFDYFSASGYLPRPARAALGRVNTLEKELSAKTQRGVARRAF